MKKSLALSVILPLTLGILLSIAGSVVARENRVAPGGNLPTAALQQQGPTDPAELEAFLDDLFGKQMKEHHIAGAAVSVVKDGKLFFAKGYGYVDIEKGIPVDPEETGFRVGSATKLFTWTAVMQFVEQGKLDLDEYARLSRNQPIRPPVDIGVVGATGDSSLIRGTPCRQAV